MKFKYRSRMSDLIVLRFAFFCQNIISKFGVTLGLYYNINFI